MDRGRGACAEIEPLLVLLPHDAKCLSGAEKDAGQIDVDDRLPFFERYLVELSRRRSHTGVIEKQIDPTVSRCRDVEEAPHGLLVGHVCWHRIKREVGVGTRQVLQARTPSAGQHHCPAVAAERRCDRGANATPCSGNHCDLVHRYPNPFRLVRFSKGYSPLSRYGQGCSTLSTTCCPHLGPERREDPRPARLVCALAYGHWARSRRGGRQKEAPSTG